MADTVGAAQLAITADASGVEAGVSKAKRTLATLGGAAKSAGADASKGIDKIGESAQGAAQKLDRDTKRMAAQMQRLIDTAEAGGRNTAKFFELTAIRKGNVDQLRPMIQQLEAIEKKSAAAAVASRAVAPAITQVGLSARQAAFAMRTVPAQVTDIVTQLAAGANPMQVLIQQGGQLKDVFGGIGPAARALGGYLLGLLSPLTLAAGAIAALGLAYFQGSKEGDAFAKAVILSGNAAGLTVGQLQQMAERISEVTGTQHAAAAALAEVVQNGTIAGESIERFTTVALRMEKETGQAVSETVKQFAELGKSPVEAATKLNEATNFLTASVARQIHVLEEQGRVADAAKVAQTAYADALDSRLTSIEASLGSVERGWRAIVGAAKSAWDAMLNVGRPQTIDQQLAAVQKQIAKAREPFNASPFGGNAEARAQLPELQEQERRLLRMMEILRGNASAQRESAELAKAQLEYDAQGARVADKKAKAEEEIRKARELGAKLGLSQIEIDKRVADIRAKFADKGAGRAALRLGRAEVGLDIEKIRGESEKLVGIYTSSERRIDALRSAGLLSDREYYDSKRAFINLESHAKEDALTQEIARYQQEKLTGAEKLQNDKKIADAQAKLAILRADTSAKLEDLSEQQIQATKREAAEFLAAQKAAEDYFQATSRRQDFELAGRGMGRRARDEARGSFDIQERYGSERQRLESIRAQRELQGTFTEDERRQYEQRLALLDQYEAKELASWQDFNQRKLASDQDWLSGAQEALNNYADQAGNVSAQVEDFFGSTFSSLEDALAQFAATGKLSFSGLVRSILADLARLQARKLTASLANALAGAIAGSFGGGVNLSGNTGAALDASSIGQSAAYGRAIGGPVSAGGTYQVNERGTPELLNVGGKQFLMMGNQSGTVKPGGGDIHIVNNTQGRVDRVEERQTSDGDRVLVLEQAMVAWLENPNSKVSRTLGRTTTAGRRR